MKRFTVQLENADYSRLVGLAKAGERPIAVEAARLIRAGLWPPVRPASANVDDVPVIERDGTQE